MFFRRITLASLGIIILFWCVVPCILFVLQMSIHRYNWELFEEDRNKVNKIRIELSLNEFNQCKINDKEICIHQTLYDIIDYTVLGNKVVLQLYQDDEEQNVLGLLNNLITFLKIYLSNLFSILVFLPFFSFSSFLVYKIYEHYAYYESFVKIVCVEKIIPPPERLCA
ncbi:MAG: hypothetical protein KatS3mg027_0183 [Bacteroidia bacterium]|nr:MAG: hypothetical protein KatS3mg027_0183 [Bacteroidia bacterium]